MGLLIVGSTADTPCCKTCTAPLAKYFSTDAPHGFCGEACIDPSKYSTFKVFESNLTQAAQGDDAPCSHQLTPTGIQYHSCCDTPLLGNLTCWGIPGKSTGPLFLMGTGPYCCPSGATVDVPCPSASLLV